MIVSHLRDVGRLAAMNINNMGNIRNRDMVACRILMFNRDIASIIKAVVRGRLRINDRGMCRSGV